MSGKRKYIDDSENAPEGRLGQLLKNGLPIPAFFDEFPLVLSALNAGQTIHVERIPNKDIRNILATSFRLLPMDYNAADKSWRLQKDIRSINNFLLKKLLEEGHIKQPNELNAAEVVACKASKVVLEMLTQFPTLKTEILTILESLLSGTIIDTKEIENHDIQEHLTNLFIAFQLKLQDASDECNEGDSGYSLPSRRSQEYKIAKKAIKLVMKSLKKFRDNAENSTASIKSEEIDGSDDIKTPTWYEVFFILILYPLRLSYFMYSP